MTMKYILLGGVYKWPHGFEFFILKINNRNLFKVEKNLGLKIDLLFIRIF